MRCSTFMGMDYALRVLGGIIHGNMVQSYIASTIALAGKVPQQPFGLEYEPWR
jgi:hypothetical protein